MDNKEEKPNSKEDAVQKITENALRTAREAYENIRIEKEILEQELQKANAEREELQLQLTSLQLQKDKEIEEQRRGSRAEIVSLQNILQASQNAALYSSKNQEDDICFLKEENSRLKKKVQDMLQNSRRNSNGLFKGFTNVVKQSISNLIPGGASSSTQPEQHLESSMEKAQEDAHMLRSLIIPLDEEMEQLRKSLRHNEKQLQLYRETFSGLLDEMSRSGLNDAMKDVLQTTEIKSMRKKLQNMTSAKMEQCSRSDLEKYIAVLITDRGVLQEEVHYLSYQLKIAQKHLSDSISTFAIALPSSYEDQMQNKDFNISTTQNKLGSPNQEASEIQADGLIKSILQNNQYKHKDSSKGKHVTYADEKNAVKEINFSTLSCKDHDTFKSSYAACEIGLDALDVGNSVPVYVVEESDDDIICTTCSKYKGKHLKVEQERQWQMSQYEEALKLHKMCLQEERDCRSQLELKFTEIANNYQSQLTAMMEMINSSEGMTVGLRDDYSKWCQEIQVQLVLSVKITFMGKKNCNTMKQALTEQSDRAPYKAQIFSEKQEMQNEIMKLKSENSFLLGKFMQKARELQLETYRLPADTEQMKISYQKMYEDLTIALVALDQQEAMMKSEIDWLTNCIMIERETKDQLSENLKAKLIVCQEVNALAQNLQVELDNEKEKKTELEEKLRATEAELQKAKADSKSFVATLEQRMDKIGQARVKLEGQVYAIKDQMLLQQQQAANAAKGDKGKKESKASSNTGEKLPENMDIDEATIKVCCASCQQLLVSSQERHFCHQCLKILCRNCIHTTAAISPDHSSAAFGKELCNVCISMIQGHRP